MSGQLQTVSDDGPARCAICGAEAAGPCARCRNPTCGGVYQCMRAHTVEAVFAEAQRLMAAPVS